MPKLRTKTGELTPYGLACGYVQTHEVSDIRVTLWHEGGPMYHVRAHDFGEHRRIAWDSFERLTDARKAYRRMIRENRPLRLEGK